MIALAIKERAPRGVSADDVGLSLRLGAIADGAEAAALYAEAAFDFAVAGDVPALAIAIGRIAAYADLMREILAELTSQNGERNFA
jgi:hypothetical protein